VLASGSSCPAFHALSDSHCKHDPVQHDVRKQGSRNAADVDDLWLFYHVPVLLECLFHNDLSNHIMIFHPRNKQIAERIELSSLEHAVLEKSRMDG